MNVKLMSNVKGSTCIYHKHSSILCYTVESRNKGKLVNPHLLKYFFFQIHLMHQSNRFSFSFSFQFKNINDNYDKLIFR